MDLDAYRAAAQAFATDLNAAHHRRFAGLDGRWDPAALYARHAALFDERAIDALRHTTGLTPGVAPLLRFAVRTRWPAAPAATDAARAAIEAEEGLAELGAALEREPDGLARVELEERRLDAVTHRLTPLAPEALERGRAEARALGWPSARALLGEASGADLGALAAEAEALLRAGPPPSLGGDTVARHEATPPPPATTCRERCAPPGPTPCCPPTRSPTCGPRSRGWGCPSASSS